MASRAVVTTLGTPDPHAASRHDMCSFASVSGASPVSSLAFSCAWMRSADSDNQQHMIDNNVAINTKQCCDSNHNDVAATNGDMFQASSHQRTKKASMSNTLRGGRCALVNNVTTPRRYCGTHTIR